MQPMKQLHQNIGDAEKWEPPGLPKSICWHDTTAPLAADGIASPKTPAPIRTHLTCNQTAVDTTLVSPLTRSGEPRSRGGTYAGAALQDARRNKERTYPELLHNRRCRLVVLGIEVGGRWSNEASSFIRMLAKARARSSPPSLQAATTAALVSRWSALLTHAAATSFAASLLFEDLSPHHNLDGDLPPLGHLLSLTSPAVPSSRLPAR